jgi:hypothetical protein
MHRKKNNRSRQLERLVIAPAVLVMIVCLGAQPLLAQSTTGTLTGRVTYEAEPLPGVTVTLSSPALQRGATAVSNATGDFVFRGLPPGTYEVTFTLDGFTTLDYSAKISTAQTRELDVIMYPERLEEEIVVTGRYETVSSGSQGASTVEQSTLEKLPVARTPQQAVGLSAGTAATGPSGNTTISGAQSYENLYTLNGVVLNENLRGQPFNMFIEDAIQETTVVTSGVSAEYGRFAGGVVNMVTKTGGNEFAGSFRLSLTNDDWRARTPLSTEREDDLNEVYEATFGGYILRDKLWFFSAGRDRSTSNTAQIVTIGQPEAAVPYTAGQEEERFELKLTGSLTPSHRLTASIIDIDRLQTNNAFNTPFDARHIDPERNLPLESQAFQYTGILSDTFFVEAQYSQRDFTFAGSGGDDRSIEYGTFIWDFFNGGAFHAPAFCGVCPNEERDNQNALAKASWFVTSDTLGSHDVVFGYDTFDDERLSDNWQSASGYIVLPFVDQDYSTPGEPQLIAQPFGAYIIWGSVLEESQGNTFTTSSVFVNDTWRVSDNLTVNLGVRWDENDGTDASGQQVVDDSRVSPRLAATWDLFGDGQWILSASAARYVTAIANSQADAGAAGGQPTWAGYFYNGPTVLASEMPGATYADRNAAAIAAMFDWYFNVYGGPSNGALRAWAQIPGLSPRIDESLASPYGDELAVGLTKRLGNRGVFRADYVHREYGDFYAREIIPGRSVTGDIAGTLDLAVLKNEDNLLERKYDALMTRLDYRVSDRFMVGGNWTWSHARGNFNGETASSGPVPSSVLQYQEYKDPAWNTPMGDLAIDQRHKVRAWAIWDAISTARHNLSVSLLQNYWSGTPYSATGTIDTVPYVGDPADLGYAGSPGNVTYFFSGRGELLTDDITRTDLALNYSFFANLFGAEVEMFLQPEVLNLFAEEGVVNVNTFVLTAENSDQLETFNPFTTAPVEGVHWEKGASFGQPVGENSYQLPRTFRISLGIRF